MPPETRERSDLVLNPNEYAFVQDRSKGKISVNVGPFRSTMSETDATVLWNEGLKRFQQVGQAEAVQPFVAVPEGSYVMLTNPAGGERPGFGKASDAVDLAQGKRIHRNGPLHFPLWPGEVAKVVQGHQLRSNEYLLARVYNEDEARQYWDKGVMKPANGEEREGPLGGVEPTKLRTGQTLVIRGNEVSFFIPPTGIEVLAQGADYVRPAVTLERLEYCILLDENGEKRYERGPSVVFPGPTETFVEKGGQIKFKATELNPNSGIYVKVIEEYVEDETTHRVGEELFITGATTPIYFPRPEHAVIKYGPSKGDGGADAVHFAVAVPVGEGRYVLDRNKGEVRLVRGPAMLLPDPRREVIVQRVVEPNTIDLWYPGNAAARRHNEALQRIQEEEGSASIAYLSANAVQARGGTERIASSWSGMEHSDAHADEGMLRSRKQLVQDTVKRGEKFTPPRTITLNTKYDGAVAIGPWAGFAVQVVSKGGARRVVTGPATELLEYDESLSVMELSTGTPKTDRQTVRTVYLRTQNNRVSDIVEAETSDLCRVRITLSYRVNFEEASKDRWFAVENYVRFLCEHAGSRIRNRVKRLGIEEFYGNSISIVRDAILGEQQGGKRDGLFFQENGMRVYDVEVLEVSISDAEIARLLTGAQHTTVKETLAVRQEEDRLARTTRQEQVKREIAEVQALTEQVLGDLAKAKTERDRVLALAKSEAVNEIARRDKELERELQEVVDQIFDAEQRRLEKERTGEIDFMQKKGLAEAVAVTERMKAITPQLIEAIARVGDEAVLEKMFETLSPIALLQNESVQSVAGRYFTGTPFEAILGKLSQVSRRVGSGT